MKTHNLKTRNKAQANLLPVMKLSCICEAVLIEYVGL